LRAFLPHLRHPATARGSFMSALWGTEIE